MVGTAMRLYNGVSEQQQNTPVCSLSTEVVEPHRVGVGFPESRKLVYPLPNFYGFTTIFSPYFYAFPFFARGALSRATWR